LPRLRKAALFLRKAPESAQNGAFHHFCKKNIEKISRNAAITNPRKDPKFRKTPLRMLQITPSFHLKARNHALARTHFLCD
jgi:hypothetical protein